MRAGRAGIDVQGFATPEGRLAASLPAAGMFAGMRAALCSSLYRSSDVGERCRHRGGSATDIARPAVALIRRARAASAVRPTPRRHHLAHVDELLLLEERVHAKDGSKVGCEEAQTCRDVQIDGGIRAVRHQHPVAQILVLLRGAEGVEARLRWAAQRK